MTVNAHFDGKAIIPDEPLDMPPNQALILRIERVGPREPAEESALAWLAANAVENDLLINYPGLTREGIFACLSYASYLAHEYKAYPISA